QRHRPESADAVAAPKAAGPPAPALGAFFCQRRSRTLRSMPRVAHPQTATLLVSCPDQRGIVAALAQLLYGHGANILDADQHTDTVAGIFFQRIHFDTAELRTDRTSLETAIAEVAGRLRMTWRLCDSARRKRVA